jgi:hypothetical protein
MMTLEMLAWVVERKESTDVEKMLFATSFKLVEYARTLDRTVHADVLARTGVESILRQNAEFCKSYAPNIGKYAQRTIDLYDLYRKNNEDPRQQRLFSNGELL